MQRLIVSGFLLGIVLAMGFAVAMVNADSDIIASYNPEPSTVFFKEVTKDFVGDWQNRGEFFTKIQSTIVSKTFLGVLIVVPIIFLLHFVIIGAKEFSHDGEKVLFFNKLTRFIHTIGALSFTLLVLSGLTVLFGALFNGGSFVRFFRYVHIVSAIIFAVNVPFIFLVWVKDMLPMPHDLSWLLMAGGYLSKEKKPVPAGKFNAGQKAWFWFATIGGGFMAFTGYFLWNFSAELDTVRLYSIIHSFLGACLVALFITHLYMVLFAIKGSLDSMLTGYKSKEEVDILHSKYQQ